MSLQDAAVAASRLHRGSANYHPTLWGDYFLTHISDFKTTRDTSIQEEYDVLKEEIRRTLKKDIDDHASEKSKLIDLTQRLGISYHFKTEIEDAIQKICHDSNYHNNDLHNTALRFRLLRQQGIKVSCDIFEGFKDSEGKFKKSLITDVVGLLSLYQAAFLSIRGEDILDEAIDFTTTNLQLILPQLSPNLAEEVRHALNRPIHKCLPRLEARQFIDFYHRDESHNSTLLKFAKLDFNMLQETHQEELKDITAWWKRLDYATKLPYSRDRIVECYFWVMGVYFEPQYSFARTMLTKVIAMISILDDTYDNYATCEELDLFTDAIQRWDVEAINALPEYMRMIFHNLLDVYNEIEEITNKEGRSFAMHYAKESLKRAVRAYLAEAKWRDKGYIPSMEEYMQVSPVSTCYPLLATTSFVGMGEIATKDAVEWIYSDPKIVRAASVICRLMDDIVSHQFEQKRKHVASGVECYIKQFGIFEEDVIKLFRKEIADAWKDMNEECLRPFPISMDLLERVLNLARVMDVIYKDDDGYTNSYILKGYVASLLKDPLL